MAATTPTTAIQGPRADIVLHDESDITLLIGDGKKHQSVKALKMVMCLTSPVWKAMLSGQWAESGASKIAFPDDDIDAMVIVLRIAHTPLSCN